MAGYLPMRTASTPWGWYVTLEIEGNFITIICLFKVIRALYITSGSHWQVSCQKVWLPPLFILEFYFGFPFQSRRPIEICHMAARLIGRSSWCSIRDAQLIGWSFWCSIRDARLIGRPSWCSILLIYNAAVVTILYCCHRAFILLPSRFYIAAVARLYCCRRALYYWRRC